MTPFQGDDLFESQVARTSSEADLVLPGFDADSLPRDNGDMLAFFKDLPDALFLDARQETALR